MSVIYFSQHTVLPILRVRYALITLSFSQPSPLLLADGQAAVFSDLLQISNIFLSVPLVHVFHFGKLPPKFQTCKM